MADRDLDAPPASGDSAVQNYLDTNWREAVRAAREALECVRKIHPELTQHLPETAADNLRYFLSGQEANIANLHRAGRLILGQEAYDEYIETQTERQIQSEDR